MAQDYTPKSVQETGEPDEYGNMAYSVLFESGESVFMKARKAPEVGRVEFGEIVDTPKRNGQGTYKKFKRLQREKYSGTSNQRNQDKNGEGMAWGNALTNAVLVEKYSLAAEDVLETARKLYDGRPGAKGVSTNEESSLETPSIDEHTKKDSDTYDDVDLSEVPF